MRKKDDKNKSMSSYTFVMMVQAIVCTVLIVILALSGRNTSDFFNKTCEYYKKFSADTIKKEDVSEAVCQVGNFVSNLKENEVLEDESTTYAPSGGEDLIFSSLDALEGVCFDKYDLSFSVSSPLETYKITSRFGYRIGPISGVPGIHTGLDMAAGYGSNIYSAADGVVVDAAYDKSYGYYVKIEHSDDVVSIYAHCSKLCVSEGEKVDRGDTIAKVGSTGDSTGNHLHFEMRKGNIRINPEYALKDVLR